MRLLYKGASFAHALTCLKSGYKIARAKWPNDIIMLKQNGLQKITRNNLYWIILQEDILAEDWLIYDPNEEQNTG